MGSGRKSHGLIDDFHSHLESLEYNTRLLNWANEEREVGLSTKTVFLPMEMYLITVTLKVLLLMMLYKTSRTDTLSRCRWRVWYIFSPSILFFFHVCDVECECWFWDADEDWLVRFLSPSPAGTGCKPSSSVLLTGKPYKRHAYRGIFIPFWLSMSGHSAKDICPASNSKPFLLCLI